jgi:hypothetical protein
VPRAAATTGVVQRRGLRTAALRIEMGFGGTARKLVVACLAASTAGCAAPTHDDVTQPRRGRADAPVTSAPDDVDAGVEPVLETDGGTPAPLAVAPFPPRTSPCDAGADGESYEVGRDRELQALGLVWEQQGGCAAEASVVDLALARLLVAALPDVASTAVQCRDRGAREAAHAFLEGLLTTCGTSCAAESGALLARVACVHPTRRPRPFGSCLDEEEQRSQCRTAFRDTLGARCPDVALTDELLAGACDALVTSFF